MIDLGQVDALFRYPIKSMAGETLDSVKLGWHGVEEDRRYAIHRRNYHGGFPWLTASRLPELVQYLPVRDADGAVRRVRIPDGTEFELFGEEFAAHLEQRYGEPVELMHVGNGVFDDAFVSLITTATIDVACNGGSVAPDVRRFRPNVLMRPSTARAFGEDDWITGTLHFGEPGVGAAISVTVRDQRCVMITLDPDSAVSAPGVLRTVAQRNQGNAGIYATVVRTGILERGQRVWLEK